jgi:hypothetical protein
LFVSSAEILPSGNPRFNVCLRRSHHVDLSLIIQSMTNIRESQPWSDRQCKEMEFLISYSWTLELFNISITCTHSRL